jgi:hypothetical protein
LLLSYIRRKRWEFEQQAAAVGQMLTGKTPAQPATTAPGAAAPAPGGLERSRSGKVFKRVSASQLMNVVQARRVPAQG